MRHVALVLLILLGGCAAPPKPPVIAPTVLTVSPQPQQTTRGWGIYPCTIQNDRPNPNDFTLWHRPNASRLIWRELGASFFRCEILPGSYDARRDDGSLDLPYLRASLERQLRLGASFGQTKFVLSIWSPPAPFKTPPTTLGIDPKTKRASTLRREREGDLCRFIACVLLGLKRDGCALPLALSVQNEPNYASPLWNGCAYSPTQWARVLKTLRAELDRSGLQRVQLLGPEGGSYAQSVAFVGGPSAPVTNDAKLRSALGGFAFHGYTVESKRPPNPQQLRSVAIGMQRASKDVWMTEWSLPGDRPDPIEHALETAQRLGREMTYVPCNYWAWWQGWYPRHPKGEVLLTGQNDAQLHVSKTYFVLQRLWHLVPVGSVVHRVASNDAQMSGFSPQKVQAVAWKTREGQTLLLVNPTTKAKSLRVRGLTGRTARPFLTDKSRDMKPQPAAAINAGEAKWSLPPRSIEVVDVR